MPPRSEKNRTLTLTSEEEETLLRRCLSLKDLLEDFSAVKPIDSSTPSSLLRDTIILGDSLSAMSKLTPASIDLLIVDPPYNLAKTYDSTSFDDMSPMAYADYTRAWLDLALPLLKETASIYICTDWQSGMIIAPLLFECLIVRNRITWQREKGRGARANWKNSLEDIWFCTVSNTYTFNIDAVKQRRRVIAPYTVNGKPKDWQKTAKGNFRDTHPSNFWDDISIPYWSMPENTDHPTQKPEKLIAKLILASSNPGDLILDPFVGSGTTATVASKLGRSFIGIEREPHYCALAQKRLELAQTQPRIQGYTDGVFWERNTLNEQHKSQTRARTHSSNPP